MSSESSYRSSQVTRYGSCNDVTRFNSEINSKTTSPARTSSKKSPSNNISSSSLKKSETGELPKSRTNKRITFIKSDTGTTELRKSNSRYEKKVFAHRLRFEQALGAPLKLTDTLEDTCLEDEGATRRGQWGQNDYLLTCLAGLIGTGNMFRFPHNVAKFGIGPYLIAYLLLSVTISFPIIFLEISHGQFCSRGPASCWQFAKIFSVLGFPMIVFWMVGSFETVDDILRTTNLMITQPELDGYISQRFQATNSSTHSNISKGVPPSLEPLKLTWTTVSCHFITFLIMIGFMVPGIAMRGKTISKVFLIELLLFLIYCIVGLSLPGSSEGIRFALTTESSKWTNLVSIEMWIDASQEVFYSNNLITGYYLTFASYNDFHSKIPETAFAIACADLLFSIFSVFGTFSYLGFFAHFSGYKMEDISTFKYQELAYYTLPAAVSKTDHPMVVSIIFYMLLLCIFYLNNTTLYEVVVTAIMDYFKLKAELRKFVALGSMSLLLLSSMFIYTTAVEYRDVYMYAMTDDSISYNITMMFLLAIAWVFGVKQFIEQTECTVGWATTPILASKNAKSLWSITWRFLSPAVCFSVIVISSVRWKDQVHAEEHIAGIRLVQGIYVLCLLGKVLYMILFEARKKGSLISRLRYLTCPTSKWAPLLPSKRVIVEVGMESNRLEAMKEKEKRPSVKTFKELSCLTPSVHSPKRSNK